MQAVDSGSQSGGASMKSLLVHPRIVLRIFWRRLSMRGVALVCLSGMLAGSGSGQTASDSAQKIDLSGGWQFRQTSDDKQNAWLPATVPGDVHLDLLRNELIPDPYYRDNEAKLQWIEEATWPYRTTIDANTTLLRRAHLDLIFEGLDTNASVYFGPGART
jgi:hypothetical protein